MPLIVQKFGGTSVESVEHIRKAAEKVIKLRSRGYDVIVVLSAMGQETDRLIGLISEMSENPNPREYDALVSTGEQISAALLSLHLSENGHSARSYTGRQAGVLTDDIHKKARISDIDSSILREALSQGVIPVVTGFQGSNAIGDVTTLGRGGSDTSAVAIAAAMQAEECQIYTDVEGVYTADPRMVPAARRISRIAFEEMLELARLGAKVLQHRSLELACKYNISLRVLPNFKETSGTLVTYEDKRLEKPLISSITYERQQIQFSLSGLPNQPDTIYQILSAMSEANIEVDMMNQSVSVDHLNLGFSVDQSVSDRAHEILNNHISNWDTATLLKPVSRAKISVVGVGIASRHETIKDLFHALGLEGIKTHLTSSSEIKISTLIDEQHLEKAIQALHDKFGLEQV